MPLTLRRAGAVTAVLSAAALLASAVPAAAGSSFSIGHNLGDRCVQLRNAPAGADLKVIQRRAGAVVKSVTVAAPETRACLIPLKPGDVVVIKRGSTTLHTATIPLIKLRINLDTNVVSGEAPTGGSYPVGALYAEWYIAGHFWQGGGWDVNPQPAGTGRESFSQDATLAYDLQGGDQGFIDWYSGPGRTGDQYRKRVVTPAVAIGAVPSKVSGTARPGSTVTIRVFKGSTLKGTLTRKANPVDGSFSGVLKLNGATVSVKPGWRVFHSGYSSSTPILIARTKDFTASAADGGSASGACFPFADWLLQRSAGVLAADRTTGDPTLARTDLTGSDPVAGETWQLWCDNGLGGGQIFSTQVQPAS